MIPFQFVALVDRVAYECAVTRREILSKSRQAAISDARGIAMYCTRRLWRCSYPRIGRLFNRTPPAAAYQVQRLEALVEFDERIAEIVQRVMQEAA